MPFVLSCNTATNEKTPAQQPGTSLITKDTITDITKTEDDMYSGWLNDLVTDYMRHSDNELIKLHLQDTAAEETWMDQGMSERNGSTYYMCQIGHHVAEEDGSDPRYVTDGWAYVDSAKRVLYEYDLPNDSLILWKR